MSSAQLFPFRHRDRDYHGICCSSTDIAYNEYIGLMSFQPCYVSPRLAGVSMLVSSNIYFVRMRLFLFILDKIGILCLIAIWKFLHEKIIFNSKGHNIFVFRLFLICTPRWVPIVYQLMGAAIIGNFFYYPFLN